MEHYNTASVKVRPGTHANLKQLSADTMVPLAALLDALIVGWNSLDREQRMAAIERAAQQRTTRRKEQAE
jgi:hypothetical protein